jgi:hypothetical protein
MAAIVAQSQKIATRPGATTYGRPMDEGQRDIDALSLRGDETIDPLISRAAKIDPRHAVCFHGHYGEDFDLGDGRVQRVLSNGLIWSDGEDAVPDSAMQEAWPDLKRDWERLQAAAWERDRRHTAPTVASAKVRAILALEPSAFELIDALYRVYAAERHDDLPF